MKIATYTYKCNNEECDIHNMTFEVVQSMKDASLVQCPDCHKKTLQKIMTPSGGFRIGGKGVNRPTAHWGDM